MNDQPKRTRSGSPLAPKMRDTLDNAHRQTLAKALLHYRGESEAALASADEAEAARLRSEMERTDNLIADFWHG